MEWRDRVKEMKRVPANEILPHPRNWRKHSDDQASALRDVLDDVGIADVLICFENSDRQLQLIDGHLRQDEFGDQLIPVIVLDVDETEALKILATLDPLAGMAEMDAVLLKDILDEVELDGEGVLALIDTLNVIVPDFQPTPEDDEPKRLDELSPINVICPKCQHEFDTRSLD